MLLPLSYRLPKWCASSFGGNGQNASEAIQLPLPFWNIFNENNYIALRMRSSNIRAFVSSVVLLFV